MSRYEWDFKSINDAYNTLYKEMIKSKNKETYKEELEDYRLLLEQYSKKKDNKVIVFDDSSDIPMSYAEYIPRIIPFYEKDNYSEYIDLLTGCHHMICDIDSAYFDKNIPIAINNDTYVGITLDFFKKMFPNSFYEKIIDIFKNDKNFLNIRYSKKHEDFESLTIYGNNGEKRISVTRHNRLSDLSTLPHELMHYVYNNSKNDYNDTDSKFLIEIEGILGGLLFEDYYKKNGVKIFDDPKSKENIFRMIRINNMQRFCKNFIIKNELLSAIEDDYFDQDVFDESMDKYNLLDTRSDYFSVFECLSSDSEIDLRYGLSTLVALDLYYIAKQDIEKALFLLKKLKSKGEMDNIMPHLERNKITFFEDDYKNLRKYIKSMTNI